MIPLRTYTHFNTTQAILTGERLFVNMSVAPATSTFYEGWMMLNISVPDGETPCGGRGDESKYNDTSISLCESLAFQTGLGNLQFWFDNTPMLACLTLPAMFMVLALPFRWYLTAIICPFAGSMYQIFLTAKAAKDLQPVIASQSPQGEVTLASMYAVYLLLFSLVVYTSCIMASLSNERYSRSLFTIQCALSQQRDALLTERDTQRFVKHTTR